jgi:shikimate kinase
MNRVGGDRGRPMLARPDIERLYAERDPLYAAAASCTIETDARAPEEIALDVLTRLDSVG